MKKPSIANKKGNHDKENYNDKIILAALDCNRSNVSDVLYLDCAKLFQTCKMAINPT